MAAAFPIGTSSGDFMSVTFPNLASERQEKHALCIPQKKITPRAIFPHVRTEKAEGCARQTGNVILQNDVASFFASVVHKDLTIASECFSMLSALRYK